MTSAHIGCDAAQAHGAEAHTAPKRPWAVLATCILASSLAFVDGTVVNVGLPSIGASLHGSAADLQWVVNAYTLPLAALLLLGGALGDHFGRRILLVTGVALFALASAGCALAPTLPWLLGARAAQGLGAALLMPNSLALLGASFTGAARGRAVGTWASAGAIAGALGPVLGGWLIDKVGWRSVFYINLPLAAAAIALAFVAVHEVRHEEAKRALDAPGGVLATLALGAFVWGLTIGSGPSGWTAPALTAVALALLLAAGFVWWTLRQGDAAMTPPALFGSRALIALNLLTLVLYGALGGFLVLVPFVLISAEHYAATAAGASLLPFSVVMGLAGPFLGGIAGRFGARLPLALGALLVAVGFAAATRIGPTGAYWTEVLPCVALTAVGMSLVAAPLTTAVLSSVDERHTGSASGLNSALARAGGLIATALLGGMLARQGAALLSAFHLAALVGAVAALAAAVIAFFGLLGADQAKADAQRNRRSSTHSE
jgi:EmrB/QacA subfamily drug resistance transporter